MRTIVVGDVHGCLEELDELLARLELRRGRDSDRLVFAGDFMDRGPDPAGVVRRVRELGAEAVMGNHEEKHLRWARHEARRRQNPDYKNPMHPFSEQRWREHEALSPDDLDFLSKLPLSLRLDERWMVVHAGFDPRKPVGQVRWATRWPGPESVVYGHHVHDLARPQVDEPAPGVVCLGIDTGCCFGGHLTAVVLPERTFVQVNAKAVYHPLTAAED